MNRKLKKQLHTAFSPPPPQRKDIFLKQLHYPKASKLDVYVTQAGYIHKRLWALSLLLVLCVFFIAYSHETPHLATGSISAMLPFLSLIGLVELQKSISHNMVELEMSCSHNFGEVTLMRLSIIGIFDLTILLLLSLFTNTMDYSFFLYFAHLALPFLASSYLSLWIINRFNNRDTLYVCGGVTGIVAFATVTISRNHPQLYSQVFTLLWVVGLITITILFTLETIKFMKKTEELSWNLS